MQQQWHIRIRGNQRKVVDVSLVVQAVIALGQQLRDEARSAATRDERQAKPAPETAQQEDDV